MSYLKDYHFLKKIYNEKQEEINIPDSDIVIYNNKFLSGTTDEFPVRNDYLQKYYEIKESIISTANQKNIFTGHIESIFDFIDSDIKENKSFVYPLYQKAKGTKSKSVIILLHGLNEKSWDKYHTWASKLAELTGKSVLMFPISFHINRTPAEWNDSRKMNEVSRERKKIFPDITETSFVNAAISTRLQFAPQTFFWSGLRTYYDILNLLKQIKNDRNKFIDKNVSIDFFSYSIGAFLTEILFLADSDGIFRNSRAFLFCGGPTMDYMYPVSKYIYDNKAEDEMKSFYIRNFEESVKTDKHLENFFKKMDSPGTAFKSMLNSSILKTFREEKFIKLRDNISALALEKDSVIPPASVRLTLNGNKNNIPIKVRSMDFPFEYDHVIPFPLNEYIRDDVDRCFQEVFNLAGDFLK